MTRIENVPTTLFTGFLGTGKTTTIRRAFAQRTSPGRWAVLVNEFGEIGIDGAILSDTDGLSVAEVPGGCICCSAGLALRTTLVRLLREVRPDRLLIEPTGLAHPATVIDTLRTPGLREAVQINAVIGLVDPRHCRSQSHRASETWRDQVQLADVLVGTHDDLVTDEDRAAFRAVADASWPPKLVVAHKAHGAIDPAWLDLKAPDCPAQDSSADSHSHPDARTAGFVWAADAVFERNSLEPLVRRLVGPNERFPEGLWRLKGIFHLANGRRRGWFLVQATPDDVTISPIGHRRDSRVDLVAPPGPIVDAGSIFSDFEATRCDPSRA